MTWTQLNHIIKGVPAVTGTHLLHIPKICKYGYGYPPLSNSDVLSIGPSGPNLGAVWNKMKYLTFRKNAFENIVCIINGFVMFDSPDVANNSDHRPPFYI